MYKEDVIKKYHKSMIELSIKIINTKNNHSEEEIEVSRNFLKESRLQLREITGDFKNTQAKWNARKERRDLQNLIIDSEFRKTKRRI